MKKATRSEFDEFVNSLSGRLTVDTSEHTQKPPVTRYFEGHFHGTQVARIEHYDKPKYFIDDKKR